MTCDYCQFSVPQGEHRCAHCGRRTSGDSGGSLEAAPRYAGATALAAVASVSAAPASAPRPPAPQPELVSRGPAQPSLFPFSIPTRSAGFGVVRGGNAPTEPASGKTAPRKTAAPREDAQGSIEFLSSAPVAPRKLKTSVEAVIYCNDPVAAPMHRLLASAIDASLILIATGLFSVIYYVGGGRISGDARTLTIFGAAFALISLFYGLLWAIWGRETAGMNFTHLRLINFDGFPPDAKSRALRIAGTWLCFCSGAIGLLWALVDEENLTWHDHMSKTFPTLRESNSSFFRQR